MLRSSDTGQHSMGICMRSSGILLRSSDTRQHSMGICMHSSGISLGSSDTSQHSMGICMRYSDIVCVPVIQVSIQWVYVCVTVALFAFQ